MAKRISGPPRRPRNPVAKAVRTPQFRQRVVPDKRRHLPPQTRQVESELEQGMETGDKPEDVPAQDD